MLLGDDGGNEALLLTPRRRIGYDLDNWLKIRPFDILDDCKQQQPPNRQKSGQDIQQKPNPPKNHHVQESNPQPPTPTHEPPPPNPPTSTPLPHKKRETTDLSTLRPDHQADEQLSWRVYPRPIVPQRLPRVPGIAMLYCAIYRVWLGLVMLWGCCVDGEGGWRGEGVRGVKG